MKKGYLIVICLLLLTGCKSKMYTVTFRDNFNVLATTQIKKGDNINDILPPSKEGYLFLNWQKDGIDYNPDNPIYEDITLDATWVEVPNVTKTYIVSFDFGTDIKTMSVKEGDKVSKPEVIPKKDKYKFIGWYLDQELYDFDTEVTEDITLVAKFEKSRIIITYDLSGGSGSTIQTEINVGSIQSKPNDPRKFGYTFTNWSIDDNPYNFDEPLYDDVTIKANYEANIYVSIMFDTCGAGNIPSEIILLGEKLNTLPVPKKDGYKFLYWSLDGNKFDIDTKIDTDITLIAIYEKIND